MLYPATVLLVEAEQSHDIVSREYYDYKEKPNSDGDILTALVVKTHNGVWKYRKAKHYRDAIDQRSTTTLRTLFA
jgi:hypothetical protein